MYIFFFFQEILKQASYCIEIEIKPHYVVPDTNCFIDYLPQLEKLMHSFSHVQEYTCTLMVPTVGELKNRNLCVHHKLLQTIVCSRVKILFCYAS